MKTFSKTKEGKDEKGKDEKGKDEKGRMKRERMKREGLKGNRRFPLFCQHLLNTRIGS